MISYLACLGLVYYLINEIAYFVARGTLKFKIMLTIEYLNKSSHLTVLIELRKVSSFFALLFKVMKYAIPRH